jgi:hypothetical protein
MGLALYRQNASRDAGEAVRELVNVAERAGISVRLEPLDPDLFERSHGGICKIEGKRTILIDSTASIDEKIAVLLRALGSVELDAVYMRPLLRQQIERYVKRA